MCEDLKMVGRDVDKISMSNQIGGTRSPRLSAVCACDAPPREVTHVLGGSSVGHPSADPTAKFSSRC